METVEEFLAHSIRLEQEAALRFGQLADAMDSCGNKEVSKLFRQLADYSRMHQADAQARAGFRDIPQMEAGDFKWPGVESPETPAIWADREVADHRYSRARHHRQSGNQDVGEGIRRRGKRPRRRIASLDRPAQSRQAAADGNYAVLNRSARTWQKTAKSSGVVPRAT